MAFFPNLAARAQAAGAGTHVVGNLSINQINGKYDKPALQHSLEVLEGDEAGNLVEITTGTELQIGESLANLANSLLGREIKIGEKVDFAQFAGQQFVAVCGAGGRVISIKPAK